MRVRATLTVAEVLQSLGDVTTFWAFCGRDALCPKCRKEGNTRGCQRRFRSDIIRGEADAVRLALPDGTMIVATDVELLEEGQ